MEEKMKVLIKKFINYETISYIIFGVLTTIVNLVSYKTLTHIGYNYVYANIVSWILSVLFAYITNKLWVFRNKDFTPVVLLKEITGFVGGRLFSGACDMAFMVVAVSFIGINDFIAKLITQVFVVIMNYFISKLIVFKDR